MLGIVQEQHPERARLFMQWKRMGWPILVDSLNLLEVTAVPLTFAIDEHGVIREARLRPDEAEALEAFLGADYPAPEALPAPLDPPADPRPASAVGWRRRGIERFLWGGAAGPGEAIAAFREALPQRQAQQRQPEPLAEHHAADSRALRPERDADAELVGALSHRVGDHGVEAGAGHQQPDQGERGEHA